MSYERFEKQIAEGHAEQSMRERASVSFGTRTGGFSSFYRYVILDTIFDPTVVDDAKVAYWEHTLGVTNIKFAKVLPRNTVIAQRVLEGTAATTEKPMFLFPFLPPALSLPCNPGEHIWVVFEDKAHKRSDIGYWMCRIVGPGFVEDVNHTHMPRAMDGSFTPGTKDTFDGNDEPVYDFNLGQTIENDGVRTSTVESSTVATEDEKFYEKVMKDADGSQLRSYEAIPRYKKRPSDIVFEGTNNSAIVLGTHRVGAVAQYKNDEDRGLVPSLPDTDLEGENVGSIDLVVGRGQTPATSGKRVTNSIDKTEIAKGSRDVDPNEGDPDLLADRGRIMLNQRSRVDIDLGLNGFNSSVSISGGKFQGAGPSKIEDSEKGDSAGVFKADKIRIIARSDIEILVTGFDRDDQGRMVSTDDTSKYAALIIKANGDIILRPSDAGYLKLGDDTADRALVCTDTPALATGGNVTAAPLITTMGGQFAGTKIPGQGSFASKILVKG